MLACDVQPRILIADDQSDLLDALRLLLKGEGMAMEAVTSPEATLTAVASRQFDLLLMDLNYTSDTTSGREGIDLVARVQAVDRLLPIIVMTGWGSVDLAVAAMRRGVRDFVQKPWDNGDLMRIVRAEVEDGRLRRKRAEAEERELAEARRIQRKLLPAVMPSVDGWEIAASWQPATGVGGDCYDAIPFGRGRLGLSIADVVGKGIPAALLMSNLQAAVRAFATDAAQPAGALPAGQSHPVRPHRRRSFHQLLLLRRRLRIGPADVCECRALRARAGPFRRQRRAAHFRRRGARSFS